ncbi:hypothetical protein ABZY34_24445, partial [Streptomyces virginiae]
MGLGYHRTSERRLHVRTAENGAPAPVVTSAGALVHGPHTIGARKIALLAPYMRPLTRTVVDHLTYEGIEVVDYEALEIRDNLDSSPTTRSPCRASHGRWSSPTRTRSCSRRACRGRPWARHRRTNAGPVPRPAGAALRTGPGPSVTAWAAAPCSSGSRGPSGRTASASTWAAAAGPAPAAGSGPGWDSAGRATN